MRVPVQLVRPGPFVVRRRRQASAGATFLGCQSAVAFGSIGVAALEGLMSEFDKLRALLDTVVVSGSNAASPPPGGTLRVRRLARALWAVFIVVTALDALYLLAKALAAN